MQPTQQPVQGEPVATAQVQQKPVGEQSVQPEQVIKKPSRWWIWVIVAAVIIGGGIWAYFQFLA